MLKQNVKHAWSFLDGGIAFNSVVQGDNDGVTITTIGPHPFETNDAVLISGVQGAAEINENLFVVEKISDMSFKLRDSTTDSTTSQGTPTFSTSLRGI